MATDAKIQDIALHYIRQFIAGGTIKSPSTTFGLLHPSLLDLLPLQNGELPLISGFFSSDSWYAFTTRRVVSRFQGKNYSINPSQGVHEDFGNFKGYGPTAGEPEMKPGVVPREVATITALQSSEFVRFEFETWEASMLPIYAARYWNVKHRVIDKLMTSSERESDRTK